MDTIKHTIGKLLKRAFICYQNEAYIIGRNYTIFLVFSKSRWHPPVNETGNVPAINTLHHFPHKVLCTHK